MTGSQFPWRVGNSGTQQSRRAAAQKPESLNEAVSNKMDETLAKMDVEAMMKLPEDLVNSCCDVVQRDFRLSHIVDTIRT
jgi:hypothetical protein